MTANKDGGVIRPEQFSKADIEAHDRKAKDFLARAQITELAMGPEKAMRLVNMLEAELGREGAKRFAEAAMSAYKILEKDREGRLQPNVMLWRVIRTQIDVQRGRETGQPFDIGMAGRDEIREIEDESGTRVVHQSGVEIYSEEPPNFRKKRD